MTPGAIEPRSEPTRPRQLTPAETRILALLPTHLTLTAIGTRVGVRRSTVKTHVAKIYRKLDARTRAEAVERAERAGLLPGDPQP